MEVWGTTRRISVKYCTIALITVTYSLIVDIGDDDDHKRAGSPEGGLPGRRRSCRQTELLAVVQRVRTTRAAHANPAVQLASLIAHEDAQLVPTRALVVERVRQIDRTCEPRKKFVTQP